MTAVTFGVRLQEEFFNYHFLKNVKSVVDCRHLNYHQERKLEQKNGSETERCPEYIIHSVSNSSLHQ